MIGGGDDDAADDDDDECGAVSGMSGFQHFIASGGSLEYLRHSPASCKRQQKGNSGPTGITGPPCSWGI
jgi:hypothetical protein